MDGILTNNYISARVKTWIETAHTPRFPEPVGIHINQLLQQPFEGQFVVDVSAQAFKTLIEQVESVNDVYTYMPTLVIPLVCSEQLITGPFDNTKLLEEVNSREPPSLYLVKRTITKYLTKEERYIWPLSPSILTLDADNVYVYYASYRDLQSISNTWEYNRAIYCEYYPKDLQL